MRPKLLRLRRLTCVFILLLVLAATMPLAGSAQGNSDNAHACHNGGPGAVIGTDGTVFGSVGDCVRHAAQGGTLVSTDVAGPCLDGGWETLAPAEDDSTAFPDLATCLTYVAGGGTPVAVQTGPVATGWARTLSHFQHPGRCGGEYGFTNLQTGVAYRIVAYRGDGSAWSSAESTLTGMQSVFVLTTYTLPLLNPGETTWGELYLVSDPTQPIAVTNIATCPA